jgi:enoyl-[acyl-carrier-protein] reductase (NADH)
MSEIITGLSHFDEKLKLKLQLNLELTEQDDKVWDKHLEILTSMNKQHLYPGDVDTDDNSLEEIIENVQELIQ